MHYILYFYRPNLKQIEFQLAQVNIARMLGPIDSPVMAEFVSNLNRINTLAEQSDGFVWRLKGDNNNATSIKVFDDDFLIVNMSVWKNEGALYQFVYKSGHVEVFRRRREWFEKMPEMYMALWYIPAGHLPTPAEAIEQLMYLRKNGETPFSFNFKKSFTIEEATGYT
ncbi:MAG: DUF3291 domain-containing protein [Ferruginibacter sp.]